MDYNRPFTFWFNKEAGVGGYATLRRTLSKEEWKVRWWEVEVVRRIFCWDPAMSWGFQTLMVCTHVHEHPIFDPLCETKKQVNTSTSAWTGQLPHLIKVLSRKAITEEKCCHEGHSGKSQGPVPELVLILSQVQMFSFNPQLDTSGPNRYSPGSLCLCSRLESVEEGFRL